MPLTQQALAAGSGFSVDSVAKDMKSTYSYIQKEDTVKSLFSRKENDRYLKTVDESLGDMRITMKAYDTNGNLITTPFYSSETGDVVVPDAKTGAVPYVNGDIVDAKIHEAKLVEDRIDDLMEKCIISDEICKIVLNLNDAGYNANLAPNVGPPGMNAEMMKLDGRVTYIKALPASSALQIQSLSKLRYLVGMRLHQYKPIHSGKSKADATKARHIVEPDTVAGRTLAAVNPA
jgi:hypothetical protein